MSADLNRHSQTTQPERHTLCLQFERFLDAVLAEQRATNSYAFRVLADEFGTSVTASIMQAADIRKLQREKGR